MSSYREEAVNVTLAEAMQRLGAPSRAETIVHKGKSKNYPDVRTTWAGLRVVIEAKYAGSGAEERVTSQVEERLESGLGEVGIALIYPAELRHAEDLHAALEVVQLRARFAAPGRIGAWQELSGVADLVKCLDYARALLIDDDVVKNAADALAEAIAVFELAVEAQPARKDELLRIVSAVDAAGAGARDLNSARKAAASISGLALLTASMLQLELARFDSAVPPLPSADPPNRRARLMEAWKAVLEHDYEAIFRVGLLVLEALGDDASLEQALGKIESTARSIGKSRALGRHDLIGRVYHTLLANQKFLATYFTSVPAATLLAGLTLEPSQWPDIDWAKEPSNGPPITVGDFACGTGTLLLSSAAAVRQSWAEARAEARQDLSLEQVGSVLIEEGLIGADVLAYALQICAATLLLGAPGSTVSKTGLHRVPFGGPAGRLGSLEFLAGEAQGALWGDQLGAAVALGDPEEHLDRVLLPELDAVIMNPPFTRSVGGSQLLGSLDGPAFDMARRRLKELCNRPDVAATLTAGLGAPFVELANRAVRQGGRLSLVLPKAFLTGEAWGPTRELVGSGFHVEYVVTSHEAGRWNFSDSTELSETLIVCRKLREKEDRTGLKTTWIALRRNPDTAIEALGVLAAVHRVDLPHEAGVALTVSDTLGGDVGEAFCRPTPADGQPWRHGTFSRAVLDHAAEALLDLKPIPLPRTPTPLKIPLCRLDDLGKIGYDRRDITDAFEESPVAQGFPALWGQDADSMRTLSAKPNRELQPRTQAASGRKLKDATQVWGAAGYLMIAERVRVVTYRVLAVLLPEPAISNTSWSVRLDSEDKDDSRVLTLWLNSTLGILSFLGAAEETQGPWIAMKKNKLKTLPVLDPTALGITVKRRLLQAWDELSTGELQELSGLAEDAARGRIDEAFCEALGIDSDPVHAVRNLLSSEPRFAPIPKKRLPMVPKAQRQLF